MREDHPIENFVVGRKLSDFKQGEMIYIQKNPGGAKGHMVTILCEFIGLQKGVVTAKVLKVSPDYLQFGWEGKNITARANKVYLWGQGKDDGWPRCHWFKKGVVD